MPGRAEPPPRHAVAVVIPAYQAVAMIRDIVAGARHAAPDAIVYVVDDGSTDGTGAAAQREGAVVLVHRHNYGKGAALRTGIERALSDGARIIVTIDADGQHAPEDIARLVAPILSGDADLVLGARARGATMPLGRRCSNWLSSALASRVGAVAVPDAQTGFRAMPRPVAAGTRPTEPGYDVRTACLHGAPPDGVPLAIGALMRDKPDFVISGINHGQNMGEDVFYSGTVAAAMEGLVAGIPSIAVSYAGSDLDTLGTHREGLRELLQHIVAVKDFPKETLLNINLPAIPGSDVKGVKVTHLGSRVFSEESALMKDPWGKKI